MKNSLREAGAEAMVIGNNTGSATAFLIILLVSSSSCLINAQVIAYPSVAHHPSSWINSPVFDFGFWDSAGVTPILTSGILVCGFHCKSLQGKCLFAVSIFHAYTLDGDPSISPTIVWSANRNNPVKLRATLQLSEKGDLILRDADGNPVWNPNTTGKFVSGLKLSEEGNLVLFDRNNETVWQSFDHPTDTLLPGQALVPGQKLTANVSTSNSSAAQFIQLGSDGHLRAYQLKESKWEQVSDLLINYTGACGFPLVCGEYGLCSAGNCACPKAKGNDSELYFRQVSEGCHENIPVSCKPSDLHSHSLLELKDYDYFNFIPHIKNTDRENCKEACLQNCSCKAAIYRQQLNSSNGYCCLLSKIFSFKRDEENINDYNSFSYIKVQHTGSTPAAPGPSTPFATEKGSRRKAAVLGSTLGVLFTLLLVVGIFFLRGKKIDLKSVKNASRGNKKKESKAVRKRFTRFSFEDLKAMTQDFSAKLGEGGFGSVFYGTLPNGAKIAVKRLDGAGHFRKSLLAEVETLGSVHHINLVTLIGFCAEKSHWLLVYEYMPNGSLDKWIFPRDRELRLSWNLRQKIILDIARGLAYLHEGWTQKILHLDIKPQNILLDENFNAQLADFGLSKVIARDQDKAFTTMRGTPGYMAPEWSSAVITEKVDVYSFGIVVLEILCGRRNVDRSQPEEEMHLLNLFRKKAQEGKFLDLVDKMSEDMQPNEAEVVKMMGIAAWCLQVDYTRRPSMTDVLRVLEGFMDVKPNLIYDFVNPQAPAAPCSRAGTMSIALPSILSGPR
ncbi:G-type lectin S-receptor-like serine/threonine-protein kinase At5g24080 [Herrania umbratica]|uniref:Receptor-like serine/threonine-protein kinase n=1 Tax=Herrania umbratica TaxID=108875 RepID=A0A6J0ZF37_9ROSI|nr:G-type lectin S-receptor-like serine/threonine-protein kinase At5g24080 [Herrania umbratica]